MLTYLSMPTGWSMMRDCTLARNCDFPMKHRLLTALAWTCVAIIVFATLSPIGLRPHLGRPRLEHVLAFGAASFLLSTLYSRRPWLVLAAMIGLAAGLEVMQGLAATRHPRLIDFLFKAAGSVCGAGAALCLRVTANWVIGRYRTSRNDAASADEGST